MEVFEIFDTYRPAIEAAIEESLDEFGESEKTIRAPVEYALKTGGKRIRPLLVCMLAHGIGKHCDVMDSALAVEFAHTSTLIADDLPCMDNDDERRGRPTVHKVFGEALALLASYALIPAAYSHFHKNAKKLKKQGYNPQAIDVAYDIVLEVTNRNIGCAGVLGGQYDDMFFSNKGREHVQSIMVKKTGALFEIASVSGWLFGGGSPNLLPQIIEFSRHFGLLFQIKDDFLDYEKDREHIGLNYIVLFGENEALKLLETSANTCLSILETLSKYDLKDRSELEALINFMRVRFN